MLALAWPAMWLLFVPVVLLEFLVARRVLHLAPREAGREVVAVNLVSTVVGVPVTWGIHFGLELVASRHMRPYPENDIEAVLQLFLSAPWIAVWSAADAWRVPAAALALVGGFWAASVGLEAFVMGFRNPEVTRSQAWAWSWRANTLSYGIIGILAALWLANEVAAR
jgi:hypothetical protein